MELIIVNHSTHDFIFFKEKYNSVNFSFQKKRKKVYNRENP